ncbi:hypothetical protein KFE25_013450 [Diacronema lutheri]|uniref:RING-type domain-containing protein n=1 Tax=Diacronema lutheri TaxID=2081491 RepID=A0A8J6CB55_DIALT|nr:hypothetical protein KFE25_013450 [Diacronema lutheri]
MQPLPLVKDESTVTLEIKSLANDLLCPICLEIMKNVVATECLHRFCHSCMEKCLRQGKKECPACRCHVATRRSLRRDTRMDGIISSIFPDLLAYEAEQAASLDGLQHEEQRALQEQLLHAQAAQLAARSKQQVEDEARRKRRVAADGEAGDDARDGARDSASARDSGFTYEQRAAFSRELAKQAVQDDAARLAGGRGLGGGLQPGPKKPTGGTRALSGAVGKRQLGPARGTEPSSLAKRGKQRGHSSEQHACAVAEGEESVVFALIRHPDERQVGALAKEVLQTSRRIRIFHLLKYLALKLQLSKEAWSNFRVSLSPTIGTAGMPSPPASLVIDSTLDCILRTYVPDHTPLVLEYRLAEGFSYPDLSRTTDGLEAPPHSATHSLRTA